MRNPLKSMRDALFAGRSTASARQRRRGTMGMKKMLVGAVALTVGSFFIAALAPNALTEIQEAGDNVTGSAGDLWILIPISVVVGFVLLILSPVLGDLLDDL